MRDCSALCSIVSWSPLHSAIPSLLRKGASSTARFSARLSRSRQALVPFSPPLPDSGDIELGTKHLAGFVLRVFETQTNSASLGYPYQFSIKTLLSNKQNKVYSFLSIMVVWASFFLYLSLNPRGGEQEKTKTDRETKKERKTRDNETERRR